MTYGLGFIIFLIVFCAYAGWSIGRSAALYDQQFEEGEASVQPPPVECEKTPWVSLIVVAVIVGASFWVIDSYFISVLNWVQAALS